jgi:hypothetical protein
VSSVHALPMTVVVLLWHPTLQARPSENSFHAMSARLGVLLMWCVRLQAMTNADSAHALPMPGVLLLRYAGLQATSYLNSFAALPVELRGRPTVCLALRRRSRPLL